MVELFALAALAVVGLSIAAVIGFVFFLMKITFWVVFFPLKLAFWAVFLPIRLLFKLMWLPVGLAFGGVGMTLGVVALPLLLFGFGAVLVVGLIAAIIGLIIPAIPFVLLGLLLWAIFRRNPATV